MDPLCFPVGTRVRLVQAVGAFASGSEGVVTGYYRRDPPAYAISIEGRPLTIPPEYLERADGGETRQTI